jgi:hypothetical protein
VLGCCGQFTCKHGYKLEQAVTCSASALPDGCHTASKTGAAHLRVAMQALPSSAHTTTFPSEPAVTMYSPADKETHRVTLNTQWSWFRLWCDGTQDVPLLQDGDLRDCSASMLQRVLCCLVLLTVWREDSQVDGAVMLPRERAARLPVQPLQQIHLRRDSNMFVSTTDLLENISLICVANGMLWQSPRRMPLGPPAGFRLGAMRFVVGVQWHPPAEC